MTVACGGGPSASKPGFNQNVIITAAAIEGVLALAGLEIVAAILAPIIAPTVYDLTTFCSTDPPSDPGIDGSVILAATNWTDPPSAIAAQSRIRQWFDANYWYSLCECTSTTTPAAPGFSSPGSDITTNPGLPSGATGTRCWDVTDTVSVGPTPDFKVLDQFVPNGVLHTKVNFPVTGNTGNTWEIPTGTSNCLAVYSIQQVDPAQSQSITIQYYNDSGTPVGSTSLYNSNLVVTDFHVPFSIASGATRWGVWCSTGSATIPFIFTLELAFSCPGQSASSVQAPCCPPDPILESKLDQMMQLLTSVFQSLPAPLTSYAAGTAHTGLSGNGTLTLADSPLAVRVSITTDPSNLGSAAGSPTMLFDRGFIVPIVSSAPVRGDVRLNYNPQLYVLPALTEQIGYSLHPGVVATITELVRGP